MTFHIEAVDSLIRALRAHSRMADVRIIVGGYPFNVDSNLWKKLSADGCGTDAQESERIARKLIQ